MCVGGVCVKEVLEAMKVCSVRCKGMGGRAMVIRVEGGEV